MAKLLPPYTLCPLIEHRKCLGVSEDSTPGCVIVTLGKNIVIRYRLSDQKQVSSWSSKDKLSAPVIFDFNSKRYVAVFKSDQVAFWHESLAQLNKLKKFKFNHLIYNILSTKECSPIVVYQNGHIGVLNNEMDFRKNFKNDDTFLEEKEEIISSSLVSISGYLHVNLLTVQKQTNMKRLHFIPVDPDRADRFCINLEDISNSYYCTHTVFEGDSTSLITLWSDGSIYSIELPLKNVTSFPGRIISKIESVDLLQQSIMLALGEEQVVIYGAAPNSEGAVLCVFNLKYGLIDGLQKLKIYSDSPKLWVVGTMGTNRYILCQSGGYLVVVPTRLVTQKLCSLVGVAKVNENKSDSSTLPQSSVTTAVWGTNEPVNSEDIMEVDQNVLENDILKLRKAGFTDHMISEELLPKLMETKDEERIRELLSLVNDIPDNWLIEIAVKFIKSTHPGKLLENVLTRPLVSDNSSLQLVRSRVDLSTALEMLAIISKLMDENPLDKSLLIWACLLLDSHYQQYLLTKQESVMEILKKINDVVKLHLECMTNIKTLQAELLAIKRGHIQLKKNSVSPHNYLLDTINLYNESTS
ncbi:hypothetical protein O3M35_011327 [Rhynocoris fuscipes]|uniref:Nucleolar protein 11 N-terminal domain-containing protein n=1 Tax=Rhynocoris fuscipes TaxID=488301 RepID=A0AAW1D0B2_9HEMI